MIPQDLKFTKSHEWVRLGEDGLATIGLSEFAVDQLGDIVFLELADMDSLMSAEEYEKHLQNA